MKCGRCESADLTIWAGDDMWKTSCNTCGAVQDLSDEGLEALT